MANRMWWICLAILCVASSVSADPYFSVGGMAVDLQNADLTIDGATEEGQVLSFDHGWGALLALGQESAFLRVEAEAAYRRNDIDAIDGTDLEGKIEAMSGMINAFITFDLSHFHPFIGAGAGRARVEKEVGKAETERDDVFAWQGMAGFSFPLNPGGLDIGYRYFTTDQPEFNGVRGEYETHNVYLAFRF